MRGLSGFVMVAVMACGSVAQADAKSWFAYGVNTALAVRQNSGESDTNEHSVMSTFGIQIKILRFLGVELGYSPLGAGPRESVRFDNPWNASALLYIVPTTPVGAYLKAGVGNTGLGRIFDVGSPQATYHAGAGLELYVTNHLVVGSEFLFLTPGARQIIDGLSSDSAVARDPSYFVAPSNFRASFRASYYF